MPQSTATRSKCRWRTSIVGGVLALAVTALNAANETSSIDAVQKVVSEWAKIRAETVQAEANWESERELLRSTADAVRERAKTLADQKTTLLSKTAGERDSLATLAAENAATQVALDRAAERLKKIGAQLVALRPALPPRLSQALELPYRSLANPALTSGERMQFVTTILNRCAQFNNAITYDEEPLSIPGEDGARLLEVIYWGASHAYALDRSGGRAYFGSPGPQGWAWQLAPEAAKPVAELIAVYRDKADPHFVEVPAHISDALPN